MKRRLVVLAIALVVLGALRQDAVEAQSFFSGKTVRILVGSSAGGGFDTYARAIARHLGRHIPGNPTVIVENVPGAGGVIAANQLYKIAKPDGLTIGHFVGSILFGQVLGQPGAEFETRKFEYLGAAAKEDVVCALTRASGLSRREKWRAAQTPVKLGGVGPGAPPDNTVRLLKAAVGLPIQLVSGYKGTAQIRLAAEGGEVAGGCWTWDSVKVTWRKAIESGEAVVVLQVTGKGASDLPGVPQAIDFAKSDEARRLLQTGAHNAGAYGRPFVLPPGTPKDRVQLLRRAFQETLKDKEFLAEADKTKLNIEPMTGEELEKLIGELYSLEPALVARLKEVLYN